MEASHELYPPINSRDHVVGPANGTLVVTQFGDFECPLSYEVFVLVRKLRAEMPDQIRFAYRHFPLNNIHPRAMRAAVASEAASAQDRFWEMHEVLFEHQKRLLDEDIRSYAESLGLDMKRFEADLESPEHDGRVREDMRFAIRSGVDTTLNLFIGPERFSGEMKLKDIALAVAERLSLPN